jgi:Polysaccharide pyruvyl transferase
MSRIPRILLVGAYERDNVGDLLFLLVTERHLGGAEVVASAPFSADMRALLDREVHAFGPRLEAEDFDAVWTVGGQVGLVDGERAYRMAASPETYRAYRRAAPARRQELLREAAGGPLPAFPYLPAPVAYARNAGALGVLTSVGIGGLKSAEPGRRDELVSVLRGQDHITVRDRDSSRTLERLGIPHALAPDAVHALPLHWPVERDAGDDGPAVVQVSSAILAKLGHATVGGALAASAHLRGRPVRILLAGTATGHDAFEDAERLAAQLRRQAPRADVAVIGDRRPLDLVAHLARARVVVASSLHVRIIASAYGVPRVSLARRKPTRYAMTWDRAMPFDVTPETLDGAIGRALAIGRDDTGARLAEAAHEQLAAVAADVLRTARTQTPADVAARAELRRRHQAAHLARQSAEQQAEIARLRAEVDRLSASRWRLRAGRSLPPLLSPRGS